MEHGRLDQGESLAVAGVVLVLDDLLYGPTWVDAGGEEVFLKKLRTINMPFEQRLQIEHGARWFTAKTDGRGVHSAKMLMVRGFLSGFCSEN